MCSVGTRFAMTGLRSGGVVLALAEAEIVEP